MRFFGACSELAHSRRFGFVHSSENDIGFEPNMLVDLVLLFPLVRYNSLKWRSARVWRCLGSQQIADAAVALTSDKTHP
jgi:hypothetical protein